MSASRRKLSVDFPGALACEHFFDAPETDQMHQLRHVIEVKDGCLCVFRKWSTAMAAQEEMVACYAAGKWTKAEFDE